MGVLVTQVFNGLSVGSILLLAALGSGAHVRSR